MSSRQCSTTAPRRSPTGCLPKWNRGSCTRNTKQAVQSDLLIKNFSSAILSFAFSGIAFDMGLIALDGSLDNHYGWTEAVPSVLKHESYTPRFNGRLRGRDILAVGMGKNVHGGESNIADGAIQISTSTAIDKSIVWGMLCYNIFSSMYWKYFLFLMRR